MKNDCLSKLTITKSGHQTTQYKKIMDALPILCTDKNYRYIDDVFCRWTKLCEAAFLPAYPGTTQWSDTYNIKIKTVEPNAPPGAQTGACPIT